MAKVTRAERKLQRKAQQKTLIKKGDIVPVDEKDLKENHSYWICGYYWEHDMVLVEPFCAVKWHVGFAVSNLSVHTMDFYQAQKLLKGEGTMLIFEDRVMALEACEAIENQNILMESFASYMTNDELVEYLNNKGGRNK